MTNKKPKTLDQKVDFLVDKSIEHDKKLDKLEKNGEYLTVQSLKHEDRLNKIDDRLDNMAAKDDLHKVMVTVEKVLKEVVDMRTEQAAHMSNHDRIDERLNKLESKRAVA